MSPVFLTNLIYTRISHDLANTAGALYNGTEMLKEDPTFLADTTVLLQNSAEILMARLKFFRQTFGTSLPGSVDMTAAYLQTLSTPVKLTGCCTCAMERILCLLAGDLFIKGGALFVEENEIKGTAPFIKPDTRFKEILEKGILTEKPDEAPALYAYFLAKEAGLALSCDIQEHELSFKIKKA